MGRTRKSIGDREWEKEEPRATVVFLAWERGRPSAHRLEKVPLEEAEREEAAVGFHLHLRRKLRLRLRRRRHASPRRLCPRGSRGLRFNVDYCAVNGGAYCAVKKCSISHRRIEFPFGACTSIYTIIIHLFYFIFSFICLFIYLPNCQLINMLKYII